ncbi:hypothetical protein [Streptomyces sp. TLI_171]|uniref:hypothetical protein n=1 Tax=Streptomyces sp. TLI_171 TaxID=1938859 RepID=UPI000C188311|nr:hypothetical protein [Streptomyces sp. TLI_171]RKE21015.1 hypothetical protein BX266_4392 [Streptomyces sp. TLI_171]
MTPPPADPVRELLDANRELCEQAVDPLEIAAALEDSGLATDGTARYRHADVFGLAEELYARVPRRPPVREPLPQAGPLHGLPAAALRGAAAHLLPLLPALTLGGLPGGALAVLAGAGAGALTARWEDPGPRPSAVSDGWDPDDGLVRGEPAGRRPRVALPRAALGQGAGTGLLLALLAAGAPGAALVAALGGAGAGWGAAWLRRHGRRQTAAATLGEFRSRLRPVLPLAVLAQLAVLAGLGRAVGSDPPATAWAALLVLGTLSLLAAAVRAAGRPATAAIAVLTAAGGAAALSLPGPAHWLGAPPPGGLLAAALGPAVLLAGCAWPLSTRPGAYR